MVACTFISAPLMFVSAKMITITNTNPSDYIKQLDAFTLDISIIGLIACLWVILVFSLTKKIFKIPHKITMCLIISQVHFSSKSVNRFNSFKISVSELYGSYFLEYFTTKRGMGRNYTVFVIYYWCIQFKIVDNDFSCYITVFTM